MESRPLVSVTIPTKNSEKTLSRCLKSIENQSYENLEVILVDSYSTDETKDIARKFGAKIFFTSWKLLGARYIGFQKSRGDYILLLDSDQILERTAVERAVRMVNEGCDMLCLEEHTYEPQTWVQRLFDADKKRIRRLASIRTKPLEGPLIARFYKKAILKKAFEDIPKELIPNVVLYDHMIVYYEAFKVSQNVRILPNAIWHIEPSSLIELWRKYYRYGKSERQLVNSGFYRMLHRMNIKLRKEEFYEQKFQVQTYLLMMLKAIAHQIGYWSG